MAAAKTLNGADSLATTGSARLNLFFKVTRDLPPETLRTFLEAAWAEDPLDTVKLIFHLRDCRGGKGEKRQFQYALKWLEENHLPTLAQNLKHVPRRHAGGTRQQHGPVLVGLHDEFSIGVQPHP